MAHHDALTGLPNRALFGLRLADAIAEQARTGAGAALLCLDLDKFKFVNDTLGHPIGATGGRILANLLRELQRESRG
jgi:diguanylate cyclase (GGDEF)-like protein